MKWILIPIDFSNYSEEVFKVATQITRNHISEIILLHMFELPHQSCDAIGEGKSIPEIILYKTKQLKI